MISTVNFNGSSIGVAISICSSASCNRSYMCLQWSIRLVVIIPILHLQFSTSIVEIEQPNDRNTQNVHSNSTCQSLKLNNQMIKTHKMYIDYVITMISTSNFYVSKTTGEATLKHVGADAPIIFLEFSVNYLVFTSNAPPKPNYLHPPPRPTLAAPLHFALASPLSKTSVSTSISPMTRQMPLCHSAPRASARRWSLRRAAIQPEPDRIEVK
jgi:hypothetical protein